MYFDFEYYLVFSIYQYCTDKQLQCAQQACALIQPFSWAHFLYEERQLNY